MAERPPQTGDHINENGTLSPGGKSGKFVQAANSIISIQRVLQKLNAHRDTEDLKVTHSYKQELRTHRIRACDSLTKALNDDSALAKKLEKSIYRQFALTGEYEKKLESCIKLIQSESDVSRDLSNGTLSTESFLGKLEGDNGGKNNIFLETPTSKISKSTPSSPTHNSSSSTPTNTSTSRSAPHSPTSNPSSPQKLRTKRDSVSQTSPQQLKTPQQSRSSSGNKMVSTATSPTPPSPLRKKTKSSSSNSQTSSTKFQGTLRRQTSSKTGKGKLSGRLDDLANFATVSAWIWSSIGILLFAIAIFGFHIWTPPVDTYFHANNLNTIQDKEFQEREIYTTVYNVIKDGPGFAVIYGSHNVGKSTLVRKAAEDVSDGVLYVDISDYVDEPLSAILASIVELNLDSLNVLDNIYSYLIGRAQNIEDELDALSLVLDYIYDGAKQYEKDDHLTIVIDSFNLMYQREPNTLDHLHSFFSQSNKAGDLRIILVCDESIHHKILGTQSFEDTTVLKIDRATEEESLEYLKRTGITDENRRKEIFDLTDGNFANLQQAAKFEDVKDAAKFFFRRCEHRLMKLGVLSPLNSQYSLATAMWAAFHEITKSETQSIPLSLFESIFSSVSTSENAQNPSILGLRESRASGENSALGTRSGTFYNLFSEDEQGHVIISDKPMFHYVKQRLTTNEKLIDTLRKFTDTHSIDQIESISDLVSNFQYYEGKPSQTCGYDDITCDDAHQKEPNFSVTVKSGYVSEDHIFEGENTFKGKSPPDLYCVLKTISKHQDVLEQRRTRFKSDTYEAAWEESFTDWTNIGEINSLLIELMDYDEHNKDDFLGKITLSLEELDGEPRAKKLENGMSVHVMAKLENVENEE